MIGTGTTSRRQFVALCRFVAGFVSLCSSPLIAQTATSPQVQPAPGSGFFFNSADYKVQRQDYPADGVSVGQGWDSFLRRKALGNCVQGQVSQEKGQTLTFKFNQIDDKESLFQSLEASASGSFNAGAFGGSGSASFAHSTQIDTSALNILASVYVDKGATVLVPKNVGADGNVQSAQIELTDRALKILNSNSKDALAQFLRACGDSFVLTVREGGQLNVLYKLKLYDFLEKQSFSVSFKASFLGSGGSGSVNSTSSKKLSNDQIDIDFSQAGGDASSTPIDKDAMRAKIVAFGKAEGFVPKPYEVYTLSYKSLPNWPQSVTFTSPQELQVYAALYDRLMNYVAEYSYAALTPQDYYFHAQKDRDDVLIEHDRILLAAAFLDEILNECIKLRNCGLKSSLNAAINDISQSGKMGLGQKTVEVKLENLGELVQRTVGLSQLRSVTIDPAALFSGNTGVAKKLSGILKDPRGVGPFVTETLSSPLDSNDPSKRDDLEASLRLIDNGFRRAYFWLAAKPINRGLPKTNDRDAAAPEIALSTLIPPADYTAAKDKKTLLPQAEAELRKRLVAVRLLPVSERFCSLSATHPMCLSVANLNDIVGSIPLNLTEEMIRPDPPAPPPPAPPPPPVRRDPPYDGPCHRNSRSCL